MRSPWRRTSETIFADDCTHISIDDKGKEMVRILSSGDIVPDDDERAQQEDSSDRARDVLNRRGERTSPPGPSSASSGSTDGGYYERQRPPGSDGPFYGETSNVSLFDAANSRLLGAGIPRIPVTRGIVLEPIHTVGILLILLIFGLPGILLIALIFLIRELSKEDSPVARYLARFIGGGNNSRRGQRGNSQPQGARNAPSATGNPPSAPTSTGTKSKMTFGGSGHRLGSN